MTFGFVSSALGALAAGAMVTSVLGTPAPPDTTLQWTDGGGPCTNLPGDLNLVVPHERGVGITNSEGIGALVGPIGDGAGTAVRGPDGTVWVVANDAGVRGVYRIGPTGQTELSAQGDLHVISAGWLDGRSAVAIIDYSDANEGQDSWGAVHVEFADGQRMQVQDSAGNPDGRTDSVSIGAGRLAEAIVAGFDESFAYYGTDGEHLGDWYDPTADSSYNAPPFYTWPIAASRSAGVVLSWIEGPDWDGATSEYVEQWELVVADAETGDESLRLDLGTPGDTLLHADFDGRFWIGTFADRDPDAEVPLPARVIVVDATADDVAARDAACRLGLTPTIDRTGAPAPEGMEVATTTAAPPAPTTAPPAPAAAPADREGPLGCPRYTDNTGTYPVRRCDHGPVVIQVQVRLLARGYDVDIDGFFGPLTEDAVIEFQADHGLEADGLVPPDTWVALIEGEDPDELGADLDGNGIVDPWEVGATAPSPADGDYVGLEFESNPPDFVIVTTDGTELSNLRDSGGWAVGDPTAPGPPYAGKYIVGDDGRHMLWFLRAEGRRDDGTPLPWTVIDVVDIDAPPENARISEQCDLDGARVDQTVVGVVPRGGESPVTPIAAWHFDVPSERIGEVAVGRVTCKTQGNG